MSDTDVCPRRNLGTAEHWGRYVERRLDGLLGRRTGQSQRVSGQDRYTATNTEDLARAAVGVSDLAEDISDALQVTPQYFVATRSRTNFSFGNAWSTVAAATLPAPAGFSRCEVSAVGTLSTLQPGTPGGERVVWPFPLSSVTSEFGPRPPLPYHRGIDFGQSSGTPIPAAHDGQIILRGYYEDWGNYTRIDCSDITGDSGSWTGYAHMNAPGIYPVGTNVTQGQTIGYVGSTGLSTGPHLHWETAFGDTGRVNPRDFMDVFGGESGTSFEPVLGRIVIGGVASPDFYPFVDMGLSQVQVTYPVFGRSLTGVSGSVAVQLQVRAPGASVPATPSQVATLMIRGGFK